MKEVRVELVLDADDLEEILKLPLNLHRFETFW